MAKNVLQATITDPVPFDESKRFWKLALFDANGEPLAAGAIPGPQGPDGSEGAQGPQGPRGADGSQGPIGPAGADGTGFNWRGAYNPVTAYVVGDVVFDSGASWIAIAPSTGSAPADPSSDWDPITIAGPPGPQGSAGPAGAQGAAGAPGPAGAQGPAGTNGTVGATGPPGPAGSSGGGSSLTIRDPNGNDLPQRDTIFVMAPLQAADDSEIGRTVLGLDPAVGGGSAWVYDAESTGASSITIPDLDGDADIEYEVIIDGNVVPGGVARNITLRPNGATVDTHFAYVSGGVDAAGPGVGVDIGILVGYTPTVNSRILARGLFSAESGRKRMYTGTYHHGGQTSANDGNVGTFGGRWDDTAANLASLVVHFGGGTFTGRVRVKKV